MAKPSSHSSAERERWEASAASTASEASENATQKASPTVLKTCPPRDCVALFRMSSWRARASDMACGSCSHILVEPSMSVKRKVTAPVGDSAMRLESSLPSYFSTVVSPSEVIGVEVMRHSNRAAESLGGPAAVEWPKACACFALDSRRLARHVIDPRPKWTLNDPASFGSRPHEPLTAQLLLVDRTGGWVLRAPSGTPRPKRDQKKIK
jgi:hypothetical protein